MDTQTKILEVALTVFNERGLSNVTVRDITKVLGISLGNFTYHFPRKEDLVETLYFAWIEQMIQEVQLPLAALRHTGEISYPALVTRTRNAFAVLYRYKFLMLDIVNITRSQPKVGSHFREHLTGIKHAFEQFLTFLDQTGQLTWHLSPEQKGHYANLTYLLGNFWVSDAELLYTGDPEAKLDYYTRLYWAIISPILIEPARRALAEALDTVSAVSKVDTLSPTVR